MGVCPQTWGPKRGKNQWPTIGEPNAGNATELGSRRRGLGAGPKNLGRLGVQGGVVAGGIGVGV